MKKYLLHENKFKKVYIGVNPGLKNLQDLDKTIGIESCIEEKFKKEKYIEIMPISRSIKEMLINKKLGLANLRFKNESHYNRKGHKVIAEIIMRNIK